MKRLAVALIVLLAIGAAGTFVSRELWNQSAHEHAATYYCPMHPSYTSDKPGDCPICNMKLVPMPAAHTAEAEAKALGAHGGEAPTRAARSAGAHAPVQLTPEQSQILGIETEKIGRRKIRETTRMAGTIMMEKMGMGLAAWVYVPIHPSQKGSVYPNQQADVQVPARGRNLRGVVDFVDSDATLHTHTIKIRLTVSNPETFLKQNMGANVTLEYPERESIAVPARGIFHSGGSAIAFVDLGGGVFEPREVALGTQTDGFYEVVSGLDEGESVAVSGNFLLDSESRIRHAMTTPATGADPADLGAGHAH